jgi:hypothetical protein
LSEARHALPTDLLALMTYNGRSNPNAAWPRERLGAAGERALPLGAAFDQFLAFARDHNAWISVQRQRLRGLVGVRPRGARQAWELDCLIDATPTLQALAGLLDGAVGDIGRAGAEKLFLRLAADSDLLPAVIETGFIPFREDMLYARVGLPNVQPSVSLRPMNPGDSYLVYRLYTAVTPESTRRCEAVTFSEWHASQELRWLRKGVQLVNDADGNIEAVVRAARLSQGILVDLLVTDEAGDSTALLIRAGVEAVQGTNLPVFVLAPSRSRLASQLEAAGFDSQGEYVSLLRRTTRLMTMPKLTPAIAKTAIGV